MKNWKIGTRLGLGFALVVLLLIVTAAIGINRLSVVNNASTIIVQDRYPKIDMARDTYDDLNLIVRGATYSLIMTEPAQVREQLDRMAKSRAAIAERLPKLEKSLNTEKGKELFKKIAEARVPYINATDHFMKLVEAGRRDEAREALIKEIRPAQQVYFAALDNLVNYVSDLMVQADKDADEVYAMARTIMIALAAIAAVLAAIIAIFATRSITRPLNEAVKVAETVAAGDLTSRIEVQSTDETGQLMQALKKMNEELITIVSQVRTGTDTIATASAQIAAGNQDLSSRTEEQASSLEETASSMEEMTSTVRQNGDNAQQANKLAVAASDIAKKGGNVVAEVVQTMGAINESSKKMADIINVIDGIAFQTNILALNAAVEAARAGEQGRGFAVVATEVRNLAQRSASAAREIKTLIDDSVGKVGEGSKLVDQAGETMTEIVTSIQRVTDIMSEITAATHEQVDGIEQINQAVTQMDQVTQQNAALVEEAAAAAESMQDQAGKLVEVVSVFKTGQESSSVGKARTAKTNVKTGVRIEPLSVAKLPMKPTVSAASAAPAGGAKALAAPKSEGAKGEDWEEF